MFILQLITDQSGYWIETDSTGHVLSKRMLSDFSNFPKIAADASLVVLLPGADVVMTSAKIPKMRASERLKAIPFALEDQLAGDPEQMSVALGDDNEDGTLNIAVFDKAKFEKQIQILHALNWYPQYVLPDYLALPWEAHTWSIAWSHPFALVRTHAQQGFATDADNLPLLLQLALEKTTEKPKKLVALQEAQVIDTVALEKLSIPIVTHDCADQTVFDIDALQKNPAMNLLQGGYRPKVSSSTVKKNWMWCGITAASFFGFLFLTQITQGIYLSHQKTQMDKQVLLAYQKIFPGSTQILEPRFRVANLLTKLKKESTGSSFLHLLAIAGNVMTRYPDVVIQSFKFSDDALSAQVQTNQVTQLSVMVNALDQAGLKVQQQSQKSGQKQVDATLVIREAT